jgi:hypothetical protein
MGNNESGQAVTVALRREGSSDQLAECLDAIQRCDEADAVRRVVVVDRSTEPLPAGPWSFEVSVVRAHDEERVTREAGHGIVLWTRSDLHLRPKAITAHLRAHRRPGGRIVVGRASFWTPAMTDDRAMFCRRSMVHADDLFCEPFPANTSVPADTLRRLRLDPTLTCGFEFVDLALRAPAAGVRIVRAADSVAIAPIAPPVRRAAYHQAAAARSLSPFLEKWPDWFPRTLLRERIALAREILPEYDDLLGQLEELEKWRVAGLPQGGEELLSGAARRLALIASARALAGEATNRPPGAREESAAAPRSRPRSSDSGPPASRHSSSTAARVLQRSRPGSPRGPRRSSSP